MKSLKIDNLTGILAYVRQGKGGIGRRNKKEATMEEGKSVGRIFQ